MSLIFSTELHILRDNVTRYNVTHLKRIRANSYFFGVSPSPLILISFGLSFLTYVWIYVTSEGGFIHARKYHTYVPRIPIRILL